MQEEVRRNSSRSWNRNDESVERALHELESATKGGADETRAREALDVLRRAFRSAQASAATDPLTGLANRAWLRQTLDERLALDQPPSGNTALLFLDLDGFKHVNDQHGHAVGDALLAEVAARIAHAVREQDLVARHGGDEFVILLEKLDNPAVAHAVAARVIEAIGTPFSVEGAKLQLGVSIGVAFSPEHGRSSSELLTRADNAMYRAKSQGGGSYAVYGEREQLALERAPLRSWTWELAPCDVAVDAHAGAQRSDARVERARR